jgi:hypothetical protein
MPVEDALERQPVDPQTALINCDTTPYPSKHLKQKKFLLVLPLLVLPFTTFLFWSLGGGRGDELSAQSKVSVAGLNVELPEAKLKNDNDLTKLSFYEQADRDSLKFKDLAKNDPTGRVA